MARTPHEFDDAGLAEAWLAAQRVAVVEFLAAQQDLVHGRVGDRPAWHVAPYVSVWAIESAKRRGWVGWWVIAGDLPTDYCTAESPAHPRKALAVIAARWLAYVEAVRAGTPPPSFRLHAVEQDPDTMLPLLEARAKLLADFAADDSLWLED